MDIIPIYIAMYIVTKPEHTVASYIAISAGRGHACMNKHKTITYHKLIREYGWLWRVCRVPRIFKYIYTTLTPHIKGNHRDIFQIYPGNRYICKGYNMVRRDLPDIYELPLFI